MHILCLADIHNKFDVFRKLLQHAGENKLNYTFDYIFVAGDILERSDTDVSHEASIEWWKLIQAAFGCPILLTPGNHDPAGVDNYKRIWKPAQKYDIYCLIDESYRLKNGDNVFFTPWSNTFGRWNWMRDESEMNFDIPEDTRIVVSHGPAYGIFDKIITEAHVGSRKFHDALSKLPHLHSVVTGHIHGEQPDAFNPNDLFYSFPEKELYKVVHFVRASVLDEDYKLKDGLFKTLRY